jgi:hypothetical protein
MDSQANIYGKASDYGTAPGVTGGMIFEVVKGSGQITTLAHVSYDGDGVTMDAAGNLYTVEFNGDTGLDFDVASVVELPKGSRTLKTLVSMNASNWVPTSSLALDAAGNLYGSTGVSSPHGGTVFELTPNTSLSIKLTGGTNPSPTNAQLTYTATITGGVPDGQTVLLEDASDNDAIIATGVLTDGSATLTVLANTLSVGTHDLIAVYGGDANHATSVSVPFTQLVTASTARSSRQP